MSAFFRTLLRALALPATVALATEIGVQEPAGYSSRLDGPGTEEIYATAVDGVGNVYVAGRFNSNQFSAEVFRDVASDNTGRFGSSQAVTALNSSSTPTFDLFVIKYNSSGQIVWRRTSRGLDYQHEIATGLAVDGFGNVFISGSGTSNGVDPVQFGSLSVNLTNTITRQSTTRTAVYENLFVAMLDADGNWQWVKPFTASTFTSSTSLDTDLNARSPIIGQLTIRSDSSGSAPLGTPATAPAPLNRFSAQRNALAIGPDGSLYVKARLEYGTDDTNPDPGRIFWLRGPAGGRIAILATPPTSLPAKVVNYSGTAFIARLAATPPPLGSPAGTTPTYAWDWLTPVTSNVGVEANGTISSVDLVGVPPNNSFSARPGGSNSQIGGLAVDADSVYLTGTWTGRNVLSGVTASLNVVDGFVARLNADTGQTVFLTTYNTPTAANAAEPGVVTVDAARNVTFTGALATRATSASTTLRGRTITNSTDFTLPFAVPVGSIRPFVARLNASGNFQWVESPTLSQGAGNVTYGWFTSIARDTSGAVYLGGGASSDDLFAALVFPQPAGQILANPTNINDTTAAAAFVAKLQENADGTRSWRWALQSSPPALIPLPTTDTAGVAVGSSGTVYWSINSLNGSGFSGVRSPSAADQVFDTTVGRGGFLLAVQPDAPRLSPTFAVFDTFIASQEVLPPDGVYRDANNRPLQPDVTLPGANNADGSAYFYWDTFEKKLYAVSPIVADIRWRVNADVISSARAVRRVLVRWPETVAEGLTTQVTGAGANGDEPAVSLEPAGLNHTFSTVLFQTNDAQVSGSKKFTSKREGYAVLLYTVGRNTAAGSAPVSLEVVRTQLWTNPLVNSTAPATIGTAINPATYSHGDPEGRNGYVVNRRARIDGEGANAAYSFDTRVGPIIPVNEDEPGAEDDLAVIWSRLNSKGVSWPARTVTFTAQWPAAPRKIIIASGLGSLVYDQPPFDPTVVANPSVYHQPDKKFAGYNPNEEHALLAPAQTSGTALFALRADLNNLGTTTSQPYALVRYQDASDGLKTKFFVYKVEVTAPAIVGTGGAPSYPAYGFTAIPGVAGTRVQPPYPLSLLPPAAGTTGSGTAYFKDRKNETWARSAGTFTAGYFYPVQPNFWVDLNGDGFADNGVTELPWLDRYNKDVLGAPAYGVPVPVTYAISWPAGVPVLAVGDTVTTARDGLPEIEGAPSAEIIYEDSSDLASGVAASSVRILEYDAERSVPLNGVVNGTALVVGANSIPVESAPGGRFRFTALPFHLKARLSFDPVNKLLIFSGVKDSSGAGRPLLLLNVMSAAERDRLLSLDGTAGNTNTAWDQAVATLAILTRNPNQVTGFGAEVYLAGFERVGTGSPVVLRHRPALGNKALTAGRPSGLGYVTIARNNAAGLGAAPIDLQIVRVVNPPAKGDIKIIFSDNALDEKVTLRHGLDFAGEAAGRIFEWWVQPAVTATSPPPPNPANPSADGWTLLASGDGVNDVVIEGSGLRTLADSWVFVRYRGYTTGGFDAETFTDWAGDPASTTTPLAAFVPGWIKRVLEGINPFEARVRNFASAPTQTYSSFLTSAGARYEGAVALSNDPGVLNRIGLIELYETVLRRGFALSINGPGGGQTNAAVNNALLLAATRISDLYMLIGNEAYADAQDPTVGFTTTDGAVGSLAPSVFAFQNQVPNLISEELALLRGRDNSSGGVGAAPVYNRLFWNFTNGLEGEPAYVQNYGITDQNSDGFINETDARVLFPMGHGDAWGHYLTAVKSHYRLLRHPGYTWVPRTESTLVAGVAVEVDYADESKFAQAAAARANTGAEIVNLTYRERYVADPAGQWQGYRDTDTQRAWGVDEWARRAGQGALFDWALANAILPAVHAAPLTNPSGPPPSGLQKIDRTTVADLRKISAAYARIQAALDQADQGLNPLGLTPGAIPFDIDPNFLEVGSTNQAKTHFEQVFDRAMAAVNNARGIFDYASELTNRLRQTQVTSNQFAQDTLEQEFDFKNRLIEIFGYPYPGTIGPGRLYPTGYDGPDLYPTYNYVAVTEVSGSAVVPDSQVSAFFLPFGQQFSTPSTGGTVTGNDLTSVLSHYFTGDAATTGVPSNAVLNTTLPIATARSWAFAAPGNWGQRRAQGTLQLAIGDVVRAEAELRRGLLNYNNHIANIQDQLDLLFARTALQTEQIEILDRQRGTITTMNRAIGIFRGTATATNTTAEILKTFSDGTAASIPTVVGLATDALSAVRGGIRLTGAAIAAILQGSAGVADIAANSIELGKERVGLTTDIEIQKSQFSFDIQEQLKVIEALLREEVGLRLDLFSLEQSLRAASSQYQIILAEGQRILEERVIHRRKVAGITQQNRYQDLTFRLFRNDALQKYRAAFDLAARYTYLAATTYDFETVQLGTSNAAGRRFLTDIARERALGQFDANGQPVNGVNGLSDPLARLSQNFAVLKGRLGINNPQVETGQFSLRRELYRLQPEADEDWRNQLQASRVANLWSVPEFRRFCRPFAPESAGAQPGLVLTFSTNVTFGQNLFGLPLGGGDSSYDSSQFATKIRSVGVWFENYDGSGLSATPRVYLVPAGTDILRAPDSASLATREFDVVDQAIPTPFPIGTANLQNPSWIPSNDSVDVPFNQIRQQSRFRAYNDDGLDPAEFVGDTRLIGRSVWNTKWMLIIPGGTLLNDPNAGLDTFIRGRLLPGSSTDRDLNGIRDIKIFFQTYAYSGN
ncbi:MAG: hypothetical protein JSR82_05200 [Verrucomicrobia bacterium]|nr:hypothetical protein [Verrucomicrobiota bacterium]